MILRCVGEQCSPLRLGNVQIVYNGAPSRRTLRLSTNVYIKRVIAYHSVS